MKYWRIISTVHQTVSVGRVATNTCIHLQLSSRHSI